MRERVVPWGTLWGKLLLLEFHVLALALIEHVDNGCEHDNTLITAVVMDTYTIHVVVIDLG